MERTVMTIDESGHLLLDDDSRTVLGVTGGGQVEVVRNCHSIELRRKPQVPSDEEFEQNLSEIQALFSRKPDQPSLEDMRREEEDVLAMAGSLAGGDDMAAELQQERRQHRW